MHDTTTHAVLRTSNDTRKPAPLRATASINGAEYSPPTRVDVSFNDETLSVDRAQLVLFCKEYLELDERIDRTHAILKDTHKQIRDLSVKIDRTHAILKDTHKQIRDLSVKIESGTF